MREFCRYSELSLQAKKEKPTRFTPKSNHIDAGLIDIQNKLTIDSDKVDVLIEKEGIVRIATVSMPFLKGIISCYTNYFSRQGSPDFNVNEIYNLLIEKD